VLSSKPFTHHQKKSYDKPGIKLSWAHQKIRIGSWLVQLKTSPNARGSKNQDFLAKLNSTIKMERENNNKIHINRDTCYYIQNLNYHLNPND